LKLALNNIDIVANFMQSIILGGDGANVMIRTCSGAGMDMVGLSPRLLS